ncbi:homoserine/threonine efflux transporter [Rodentibacter caecimuris]|uniref:Threonine efflux protein n=1 Tax=Rodentibacter caecimuris TaxID=1796644 RepID=A0ABX3KWK2_9PAST|nr:hypothetical protein BKG89_07115 [Rodentibacter heylii]
MLNLIIVHLFGLMTPGPDFFYVSRMAASNSRRNTVCAILGITIGVAFWATASMLGLALLFVTFPTLHGFIMVLGGSYLAYLGFLMVKCRTNAVFEPLTEKEQNQSSTIKQEILKGLWINLSNAKVVIYFSSVMSLVLVNISNIWQISIALLVIVGETFAYFYVVSLIFSRNIAKLFYSRYSRYIDNTAGIVFFIFGVILIYNGMREII